MEYDAALRGDFAVVILILEQSELAITVTAELNSYSSQHKNLAQRVSCVIHLVKQQLMEAVWTPAKGLDYTSFSYLTRGWSRKEPRSVVDAEGRKVLLENERPADYNIEFRYDPLRLNGCILLDHENKPVRDIPGLPFTLKTGLKGYYITGLRRCLRITMKE